METTEEGGVEESEGGKDDTIVAVLKDLGAESVEKVFAFGLFDFGQGEGESSGCSWPVTNTPQSHIQHYF